MSNTSPFSCARRIFPAGADIDTWRTADGWSLRRLQLRAPAEQAVRGSLLWLGGRGDHLEKYVEAMDGWHHAGWNVDSFDWRGQGGSGRLSADPHVGHVEDFAIWTADLAAYVAQWQQETPPPHVVFGHSMGGHLVLRALAERSIAVDAAVLIAPMLGFKAPYPDWLGHKVASFMSRIADPARAAWKVSEKPGSAQRLRQSLLTHDDARYADELWWHAHNPVLLLGPASWRWVERAYASFMAMAQPNVLESVQTPLLILSASADALVDPAATRRDAQRLPNATFHEYGHEAAHELLREVDLIRDDAWSRIAAFLDESAPRV